MGNKNTEISARITEIIERVGENASSFAKALGYSRAQTIYDIQNGKSAPSYDFFNRFANAEISASIDLHWLLTGKGDMFKTKEHTKTSSTLNEPTTQYKDTNKSVINQEYKDISSSEIVDKLISTITKQADEISKLHAKIAQLEREKGKNASNAQTSGIANAG